jgi:hypothetical protein
MKWATPPLKDQFQMITKEIFDYLRSTSDKDDFANIIGVKYE